MKRDRVVQALFYNNPDNYPPIINGTWLLSQAGWKVELYCRDDGKRWDVAYPDDVKLERIKPTSKDNWKNYLHFVSEVIRRGGKSASIIVGHDMHGLLPARLLAARNRRPLVYHCHDFSEPQPGEALGARVARAFERRFARTAKLVVIPDADRAAVIARELKLKRPPLVAANAPLRQRAKSGNCLRQALAQRGYDFERIVLRQGRIGPGHAIEATIRSIPNWISSRWGFVVMGLSDNGYLEHLNSVASSLGVAKQFAILPPVSYDNVASFTSEGDVGHALYEPTQINNVHITTASNKIMEYMEAGIPLLVSDTVALRSFVEGYNCGLTANEGNPDTIAAALNTLLSNPALALELGAAARAAFENEFCYERQFAPVRSAMEQLCAAWEQRNKNGA
jgi:glycosyltransferase involved in cell wall biosynthesis